MGSAERRRANSSVRSMAASRLTSDPVELDKEARTAPREAAPAGWVHESALDEQLAQPPAGDALLTRDSLPDQDSLEITLAHELVA